MDIVKYLVYWYYFDGCRLVIQGVVDLIGRCLYFYMDSYCFYFVVFSFIFILFSQLTK